MLKHEWLRVERLPPNGGPPTTGAQSLCTRLRICRPLETLPKLAPRSASVCQKVEISRRGRLTGRDHPLACIPIRDEKCHVCCAAGRSKPAGDRHRAPLNSSWSLRFLVDRDGAKQASEDSRPPFPSSIPDRDVGDAHTSQPTRASRA